MVTGSVAAFLVLETESHARARGASGLARLGPVVSGASRRRGADTARATAGALAAPLVPSLRAGYQVFSGASGVAAPTAEEAGFLGDLRDSGPAQGEVRTTADLLGHAVEASFPANLGLAALAVQAGVAPQALVTGFGLWRGEALALVEPVGGGVT